jgi:hypothetical protein
MISMILLIFLGNDEFLRQYKGRRKELRGLHVADADTKSHSRKASVKKMKSNPVPLIHVLPGLGYI